MQTDCGVFVSAAIHQRRHALLHPDQDERQRERRRERTNPHTRLPQDRSDAALYEPHRQHGTGCFRHVIITWLCWRRGIGRVGQNKSTRLLGPQKSWLSSLTHLFSWLSMRPKSFKTLLTAKMHSQTAPYKLRTETRNIFFFFLIKWMFEKEIRERRREMCCNKEAVNGACFWNFLQCSFMWGKKTKKTLFFSVTPALCHCDGAVDVSLRVQYLHLHCWPCTT